MKKNKFCPKCKKTLLAKFFNKRKNSKYLRSYCKNCETLYSKEWAHSNPDKTIAKTRRWQNHNPEKARKIAKNWRRRNPDRVRYLCNRWRKRNRQKFLQCLKKYNNKYRNTVKGRLDYRMSRAIYKSLRTLKLNQKWTNIVGYTAKELKKHLEQQFSKGMTWQKFLIGKIHIDHIKPISAFNYSSPKDEDFKQCWSLNNLQPLWAKDNLRKNAKYPTV